MGSLVYSLESAFTVNLTGGTTYTILVDGRQGNATANFTLTVLPPT